LASKAYWTDSEALAEESFFAAAESLAGRDLCSVEQLTPLEAREILRLAAEVKQNPKQYRKALDSKQLVMFFEKASLRTRITFETAINTLGGSAIFIDSTQSRLGDRESLADIAHNVERWVDVIVLRTFSHETILGIAEHASVPVINALSDLEHPCQALGDFMTLEEKLGDASRARLTFVGDGNNVAHSLLLTTALIGAEMTIATPKGYEPVAAILESARAIAQTTGARITVTNDPVAAMSGANAVYTDAWASMGQEHETQKRTKIFMPFQVNEKLMSYAAPDAVFLHCLPAHRGYEATDTVLDGPQSVIFDEAENRMHVQKAILLMLLGAAREGKEAHPRGVAATSRRQVASAR
jgi:ornithine carbamoyltransferase